MAEVIGKMMVVRCQCGSIVAAFDLDRSHTADIGAGVCCAAKSNREIVLIPHGTIKLRVCTCSQTGNELKSQ